MIKLLTKLGNFCALIILLGSPFLILMNIQKIDAKIEHPKVIIYKVDNAGGMMVGKITDKEIIAGRYTVTIGAYGKFLVTKEQFESLKIGDEIPEYLKGRGS